MELKRTKYSLKGTVMHPVLLTMMAIRFMVHCSVSLLIAMTMQPISSQPSRRSVSW